MSSLIKKTNLIDKKMNNLVYDCELSSSEIDVINEIKILNKKKIK